jgi:hypothetical protein
MTVSTYSSATVGWLALAAGAAGLAGVLFIILFFGVGQPFGTLNDLFIGLAAILTGILACVLYSAHHAQSPQLSQVALAAALAGAPVVVVGSVLVISGVKGWFLAGLYMTVGNALIGLWLAGLTYSALQTNSWPHGLAVFGLVAGVIMIVGLVSVPGILRGVDAQASAPWYVNAGYVGGLGWMLLYPAWSIWLGRILLLR